MNMRLNRLGFLNLLLHANLAVFFKTMNNVYCVVFFTSKSKIPRMFLMMTTIVILVSCGNVQQKNAVIDKITTSSLPSGISIKGHFNDGLKSADAAGVHFIVISTQTHGRLREVGWQSRITMEHYSQKNGQVVCDGVYSDSSKDVFSEISYLPNTLIAMDVDMDGIVESRAMFKTDHSGDPFSVKYLFNYRDKVHMIHGEVPMGFDESTDCETIFSPSFEKIPEKCATFAKNDWNLSMKDMFSCFIVGNKN